MKLTLSLLTISCLAAFMTVGTAAHADTYAWESTGEFGIGTGSGTLTAVTDPNIQNALDVTNFSGNVDGSPILGLLPCAAYNPNNPCSSPGGDSFFYDNLLYPSGPSSRHFGSGFSRDRPRLRKWRRWRFLRLKQPPDQFRYQSAA